MTENDDEMREAPEDNANVDERLPATLATDEASPQSIAALIKEPTIQQTAFVRLIRERDEAQRTAKNYQKEALQRRQQVQELQAQLTKSRQLMELVYNSKHEEEDQETQVRPAKGHRGFVRSAPWTRKSEVTIHWRRNTKSDKGKVPPQRRLSEAHDAEERDDDRSLSVTFLPDSAHEDRDDEPFSASTMALSRRLPRHIQGQ
jgi:hypothetical protein